MKETIQYIEEELSGLYPKIEIKSFIRLIIENVCNLDYTGMIIRQNTELSPDSKLKIKEIVEHLKESEPIQYILGEAHFMDLKLKITKPVFIPRPETEELAQWIIDSHKNKSPEILDIGTGSGCIALALERHIRMSRVSAVDISQDALNNARYNSSIHNLSVNFFNADIFQWENYKWDNYDIIVSNPPYVMEKEKNDIEVNILKYEPWIALFVPDDNPLIFYRTIAEFARNYLKKGGWIYFEINEKLGDELRLLLLRMGFGNIEIKRDISNKERMVRCCKK
jgi:release factor glutamine methyltransferase